MSASFSIASFSAYSLARPFFSIEFAFLFSFLWSGGRNCFHLESRAQTVAPLVFFSPSKCVQMYSSSASVPFSLCKGVARNCLLYDEKQWRYISFSPPRCTILDFFVGEYRWIDHGSCCRDRSVSCSRTVLSGLMRRLRNGRFFFTKKKGAEPVASRQSLLR
jgi:hypothetical protein